MPTAVIGALRVDLDLGTAGWSSGLDKAGKDAEAARSRFQKVGSGLVTAGAALTVGVTAPFVAFARGALEAASNAGELQSAFNATFGSLSKGMNEWAEATGNAMGRSTREIQEGANAFGLYFNQAAKTKTAAAEMSKEFTVLAQDLASFHNTGVDEALLALRSGLSGESEPMRKYGVFLNDAAVSAKALEMGLKPLNGKLTDQQKIMARAALIMDATATAQGDVIRTSDSAANRVRASKAAWEELQIVVGTQLLPALTPLLAIVTDLVTSFTNLPEPVQSTVVAVVAVAAALGPIITLLGGVVSLLPSIGGLFAGMGTAGTAASGGLLAALGPILPIVAAIAGAVAAGYAVWKHWDDIAPVLSNLWETISSTLGPPLVELFNTVKQVLVDLWNGPFGTMLKGAAAELLAFFSGLFGGATEGSSAIRQFGAVVGQILGGTLASVFRGFIALVSGTFAVLGNLINAVVALVQGDFAGVWEYLKRAVVAAVNGIGNVIEGLVPGALGALRQLVDGAKQWLVDKLTAVANAALAPIRAVTNAFAVMYDKVVGNSYVPDMVDEIAAQMSRLDAVMVKPAKGAAEKVSSSFRALAEDLQPLLDQLFPDERALLDLKKNLALIDRARVAGPAGGGLTAEQADEARSRLFQSGKTFEPVDIMGDVQLETIPILKDGIVDLGKALPDLSQKAKQTTAEMVESFAGMARDVLGSLRGMVSAFKGGDILGGLSGLLDIVVQVAGLVGGAKGGRPSVNVTGGGSLPYGGGRALGGPVVPGKRYRVGERGSEWFEPNVAGRITPGESGSARSVTNVFKGNLMTPEFWNEIGARDDAAAIRGATGGAQLAQSQASYSRSRYLG